MRWAGTREASHPASIPAVVGTPLKRFPLSATHGAPPVERAGRPGRTTRRSPAAGYDYLEVYLGVTVENVSARLYYSNRYFGEDSGALYAEVNAVPAL